MSESIPETCRHCDEGASKDHWFWKADPRYRAGGKWRPRCLKRLASRRRYAKVKADPEALKRWQQYSRQYHGKNKHRARYKAYMHRDKVLGRENDLDTSWAYPLMFGACLYCGRPEAGGLDRKDNSLGHHSQNVVSCCEFCNMLLGDLPFEAKMALSQGLTKIREQGLAEGHVPAIRRPKGTHCDEA